MPAPASKSIARAETRPLLAPLWLIALLASIVGAALFLLYPRTDLERRLARMPESDLSAAYVANLLRSDPNNPTLRLILARRQAALGQFSQARTTLQPALSTKDQGVHQQALWVQWELTLHDFRSTATTNAVARNALRTDLLRQLTTLSELPLPADQKIQLASTAYLLQQPALGNQLFQDIAQTLDDPKKAGQLYQEAASKALANGDYRGSAALHLLARKNASDPAEARRHFHQALRILQSGNLLEEALSMGEREIGPLADDPETLLLITRLARAAGRPDVAERYVRHLLKLALLQQWRALEMARAWGDGSLQKASQQAKASGPGIAFDDNIYTLGYEVFLENRKLEDAWRVADSAVRQAPGNQAWRERLAQVAEWTGRPQQALKNWLALAQSGYGEAAWDSVLRLAPGLFDDSALIPALHHQITRRPGDFRLVRELVAAYERQGNPQAAIQYMQRLTQNARHPALPDALLLLAELAERDGDLDLALANWERLFAQPGQLTSARALRVAVILLIRGRHAESLTWLERARAQAGLETEDDVEYWRLNGQLSAMLYRDEQAIDAFRRLIDADKAQPADFDALIRLLADDAPLDAARVAAHAWDKFDSPAHLIQALSLYSNRNHWTEIGQLMRRLDSQPGATRHALAPLRANPEFLRLLGTYQQNVGQFALARRNFEAALQLAPDSAPLQQALLWLHIDTNDAVSLRKLLATHEARWAQDPSMHDSLAASYQALSLPQVALQRYLKPQAAAHRDDLLWMMNYADALDQNQQSDLAWRLRRQLLSEEWQRTGKQRESARRQWLSEEGLEKTRQIARTRLMLTQRPGDAGIDVLRELLRLDRTESDSFSNAAAETAIGWLQDNAEYSAERAFLWHQYARAHGNRANRPLWAEITVALAERDTAATGQLLETFDERLPRYDRVNAARAVDDLRLAQTAAFEAQTDQTDDDATHLQLTETLLQFSDHAGFTLGRSDFDSLEETHATTTWHLAIDPRLALDVELGQIMRQAVKKEIIRAAPDETLFSSRLSWRHPDGETIFLVERRDSFASYTPLQIEHEQRIDDRLALRLTLGKDMPSQESQPLRIAGMKDLARASLRYRPTRLDQIIAEHWREDYRLQTGAKLGDGRHTSLTYAHTLRQEARDLEFSVFWSKHEFDRVGSYQGFKTRDARIERYYPRDFISSGGNQPPGPDYFLPDNFSFYGIRLSTDMRYEREYTRATRPFASIARTWHSILGAGYDLRLGLAGSVLGADHLALSFGMGKAGTQTNAPVRDLFLNYRIHF